MILFVDGENFRYKVEEVLRLDRQNPDKYDFARIKLNALIECTLRNQYI